jgi:DNA-binding CsgD family transcriptional regulator
MANILQSQDLLNKILSLKKTLFDDGPDNIIVLKDNYINEFSDSENSVKIIFDQINFNIIHISQNVERLGGYSASDFNNPNLLSVFKLFTLDHADFMYVWVNWVAYIYVRYGGFMDLKQVICGVKAIRPDGSIVRLLLRHYPLETTKDGVPTLSAITLDDITHLMKSDFYWGRLVHGKDKIQTHHFISIDKNDVPHDILSEREKSILKLLAEGKESKEIANLLFISSHTVDNHRRNMINRIGVRDTTGLIQICKMCGII